MPGASASEPAMLIAADPASVPAKVPELPAVDASQVRLAHVAPATMVTVPVECESKTAVSDAPGTPTPPMPPEVSAHGVVVVPSQLADPPTQK